jgi:hypothetical protein
MFSFWRSALGLVVGLVVFLALVVIGQGLSSLVYTAPSDLFQRSVEERAEFMQSMPVAAHLLVLASYALATFVGGFVAARIAGAFPLIHAGAIGGFCLLGTAFTFRELPPPEWFMAVAPIAIIVAAFAAAWLATPKPDSLSGEPVVGDGARGAKASASGRRSA